MPDIIVLQYSALLTAFTMSGERLCWAERLSEDSDVERIQEREQLQILSEKKNSVGRCVVH